MTASPAGSVPQAPFPPQDIASFLAFCAGEWLALRSCFELESGQSSLPTSDGAGDGDGWHSSERAELLVAFLEPAASDEAGGLRLRPPGGGVVRELHFGHDGNFRSQAAPEPGAVLLGSEAARQGGGSWQLWPDGSLELTVRGPRAVVRERIWFTKPNLRLRSSVEHGLDGSPGRASFSSEIRRVSRPTGSAATTA